MAPLTEDLLKFFDSGVTGANFASVSGAGIGFAATENALYFFGARGEPLGFLITLIAVRAASDPLIHLTAMNFSTLTWYGKPWGLPATLVLHALWNTVALVEVYIDPTLGLVLLGAAGFAVLGILLLVRRNPDIQQTLSDDWRMNPWTGSLRPASAA